jgi:hypothetical protein
MKANAFLSAGVFMCGIVFIGTAAETDAAARANYGRPFETKVRPALLALPPGAVEPQGWLRDGCLAAKDGYTGHMDDYHAAFRQAWATNYTLRGEKLNWPKGGWPYEGGGYWFDGLARLGYALHDDSLTQQAQTRLGAVCGHHNADGILFLWWLDKNTPDDAKGAQVDGSWPIWACGLLGRALSGYYAGSRDPLALQTLETAYGHGGDWMLRGWGMSNPWPAFDTYTWTGNKAIADKLTALFSSEGGGVDPGGGSWNRYRKPPNAQAGAEKNDHVVHFLETTTPWALGYLWTGNRQFLDTALAWHDHLERVAMLPSGVPVADEWYGPVGAFRGTETCDVAGYLWSQTALLTVCGQGRLADRAERAFFNAGPLTVSRDFKTHVYFQSPNRIVDRSPNYPHGPKAEGNSYQRTHGPLCCTAALNRILPWYVTHMWMATQDNGLVATYYGPCKVTALAADRVPVEIACRTDYPFNETVDIAVNPAREATFPLSFRIPGWCAKPVILVNGAEVKVAPDANGFARFARLWKPGDTVRLHFPMTACVLTGTDANAQNAPYASVTYGPLLFALPIPDTKDENTPDPTARWQFALEVGHADLTVERGVMPARWDWPLASPLKISARAVPVDWSPSAEKPSLPAQALAGKGPAERIALIPYGCAKFRISMFPVANK